MKKFNILLFIVIGLASFLVGYILVSGGIGSDSKTKTGTILDKFEGIQGAEVLEITGQSREPIIITDNRVSSPTNSSKSDHIVYFEKETGKLLEYSLNDKTFTPLLENSMPNFISAVWSPTKEEVISSFYSPNGADLRYYSLTTKKMSRFSSDIRSAAFSPDGNLISYYQSSVNPTGDSAGKIVIAQPDNSYQKTILNTRIEDIEVSWPAKDRIALETKAFDLFILTEDGKLNKLLTSRTFLENKWSRSGDKLLFSTIDAYSERKEPSLFIIDIESRIEKPLDIGGNASRCAWSIDESYIYCALASSPSADDIYRINVNDMSKELITETQFTVKDMFLSGLDDYLILSSSDDMLYSAKLSD